MNGKGWGFLSMTQNPMKLPKDWEKLGVAHGKDGILRPKVLKRWMLELATKELLRRPKVKPQHVERIVGHYTHIFLLKRPLLSIFNYVYVIYISFEFEMSFR